MFGKRLESLRKAAGLSQAEFGRKLGEKYGDEFRLSQTVVSAYEKGIRMRSPVQIRLAALLLCPGTLVLVRFRALFIFTEIFIAV